MKKIFTLMAVAAMAVSASAQVQVLPDFTLPEGESKGKLPAGTVLVDNDAIKAATVYEANCGYADIDFSIANSALGTLTNWFELRVDKDPSAENPDGVEKSGCTSVNFSPKADMTLSVYVRTGNNKTIVMTDKAEFTVVEPTAKVNVTDPNSESNDFFFWTYDLKGNADYVLTERGGTGRFYGFQYTVAGGEDAVSEIAAEGVAEYYNLQGVRVANPENGLYIKRQGNKAVKVLVK